MLAALHLLRVFFTGSSKRPREANWLIGVAMFARVTGALFTGTVLRWEQEGFEALGHYLKLAQLLGGRRVLVCGHLLRQCPATRVAGTFTSSAVSSTPRFSTCSRTWLAVDGADFPGCCRDGLRGYLLGRIEVVGTEPVAAAMAVARVRAPGLPARTSATGSVSRCAGAWAAVTGPVRPPASDTALTLPGSYRSSVSGKCDCGE